MRIQFRHTHSKFADVCGFNSATPTQSSRVWRNWQTRWIQVPVTSRSYRFKSCYPHQKAIGFSVAFSFLAAELAGLAAARSRSGSDSPPDCHSLPSRRFATRWIQVPVTSRSYRFKSCYPHQKKARASVLFSTKSAFAGINPLRG